MAQYTIGEALSKLFEETKWKPKVYELQIQQQWESIVGATIAKYTKDLKLTNTTLYLSTDIAPLKQEILMSKGDIISRVNTHFQQVILTDIIVR